MNYEIKDRIYRVLRDYQDGKFNQHCGGIGMLDTALSKTLDEIAEVVDEAIREERRTERVECAAVCRDYAAHNVKIIQCEMFTPEDRAIASVRGEAACNLALKIIEKGGLK